MSNSRLNKLKSGIIDGAELTLNLSSKLISDSNDEANFPHGSLLTDTKVLRHCNDFANGWSANIKFSKTHQCKVVHLGGLLLLFLGPTEVVKRGAPILAKTATKYFVNKGINMINKTFTQIEGSGIRLRNNKIKDIVNVIKRSLENKGILLKGIFEKVINQNGRFVGSLMRVGLLLMNYVLTPLAKNVLLLLAVTAAASATDAAIQKNLMDQAWPHW